MGGMDIEKAQLIRSGGVISPGGLYRIACIHQVNESVPVDDLEPLREIYRRVLERMLLSYA